MFKELFKYGSGPTQVKREYNRRYNLYVTPLYLLMFFIFLSCALALYSIVFSDHYYFIIIFLFILGLTYIFVNFFGRKILKNEYSYGIGNMAEESTVAKLTLLGDEFKVINDISKGEDKENIDHVVVGPTGVFVIETKSNIKSSIFYYKNGLRKTSNFGYKAIKQVSRNAVWIGKKINEYLNTGIWVQGLVVRPLKENNVLQCYFNNKVCVLSGDEIFKYIKDYKYKLSAREIGEIYTLLVKIKKTSNIKI